MYCLKLLEKFLAYLLGDSRRDIEEALRGNRSIFFETATVLFIVSLVLTAVSAIVSQAEQRRAKKKMQSEMDKLRDSFGNSGYLINTKTTVQPLKVVYGLFRVGVNRTFEAVSGPNNGTYHCIASISEGEIEGVDVDAQGAMIWLDEKRIQDFGASAYFEVFNGSATQGVCTTLQAAVPEWNDANRYRADIYLRCEYNEDIFMGIPEVTIQLKARKLYDPRTETTAWSRNPALVWYDWMTNKRYSIGIDASLIDTQSVIDAANWCDANEYYFDGAIYTRQSFFDNLAAIEQCFRGATIWSNGKYKLIIHDFDTPVMHLTEDDDIVENCFSFAMPGIPETPNRIRFSYPEPAEKYMSKIDFVGNDNIVLLYDGEERDEDLELIGVTSCRQAKLLATYELERSRLNTRWSFTANLRAIALEPGDIIQITYSPLGWVAQTVRVESMGLPQDGRVSLVVIEENAALYNDEIDISSHTSFAMNMFNPSTPPPPVGAVVITEEIATNKDITYSRLNVSFTKPSWAWWDYAQVWVSLDNVSYDHYKDVVNDFTFEPAEQDMTYYFKLVSVSIYEVKEDMTTVAAWTKSVQGKNLPPPDVPSFTAINAGDTINLKWATVNDIDIAGYEIRRGATFNEGLMVCFIKGLTYILTGVKPGEHTFWLAAKDTTGNYSPTPISAQVEVFFPSNYEVKHTWPTDFDEGTHDGTAWKDDSVYGRVLYVPTTALTGTWTSPIYDMGSIKKIRIWSNLDYFAIGDETIWEGKYDSASAWEKYPNAPWTVIFSQSIASGIEMVFFYSTDGSTWNSIPYFELFSAEIEARYASYTVTIDNISTENYIYIKPVTLTGAYWQ